MPMSRQEFEQRAHEFNEWADKLSADLDRYEAKYGAAPLVTDWEDVEQLTNVIPWCDACQSNHWPSQCDPDVDEQRLQR